MADAGKNPNITSRLASHNLLPEELLKDALNAGQQALAGCSLDRPPMARGVHVWGVILETLRQRGRPSGWHRSEGKLSSVISPDGLVQIVVASGDESTGIEEKVPHTKYPRGAASIDAIEANQMSLFPNLVPIRPRSAKAGALTWILLHRRLRDTVRWELSLPKSVDQEGVIQSWAERIVLEPLSVDLIDDALIAGLDLDDDAEQYDPIVTRKPKEPKA
jgi:hypothetical protein